MDGPFVSVPRVRAFCTRACVLKFALRRLWSWWCLFAWVRHLRFHTTAFQSIWRWYIIVYGGWFVCRPFGAAAASFVLSAISHAHSAHHHDRTHTHTHRRFAHTAQHRRNKGNTQHTNFHTQHDDDAALPSCVAVVVCVCTLCLAFLRCNRPLAGFPSHTFYTKYFACTRTVWKKTEILWRRIFVEG